MSFSHLHLIFKRPASVEDHFFLLLCFLLLPPLQFSTGFLRRMSFFNIFSQIMSNPFSRWSGRWSAQPKTIEAPKTAPSEEELAADQKVLDKSVADAVNAVLTSEVFTKAVAVHLAEQIQPTLKSSLDISAVEAKLLASNDTLAQKVKDIDGQTTAKISELASQLSTNHNTTAGHFSGVEESIGDIKGTLAALEANLKIVQEQVAAPDSSETASQTAKLDTISSSLQTIQEQGPAVISSLSSHASKLDAITAQLESLKSELAAVKAQDKSDAILSGIKTSNDLQTTHASAISAIKIPSFSNLESKIDAVSASVSDLSKKDSSADVLAAVKANNETQAGHAASISEIKSLVSTPAASVDLSGLEAAIQKTTTELESQKSTLDNLKTAISAMPVFEKTDIISLESTLKSISASIDGQSATLSEIKTVTATPATTTQKIDLSSVESSLKQVLSEIATQSTTLAEVRTISSKPAPAIEKTDVTGIESSLKKLVADFQGQNATLDEIKTTVLAPAPAAAEVDLSEVESSLKKVVSDIDSQNATLAEIKSVVATPAVAAEKVDLSGLEASLKKIGTSVDAQTSSLEAIKSSATKNTNSELKASIDKALTTLDAQNSTLRDIKTTIAVPAPAAEKVDLSSLESSVSKVLSSIEAQSNTLDASKTKLETLSTDAVIKEVKSIKATIEAIPAPTPAADNSELVKEVKAVKVAVDETKKETETILVLVSAQAAAPVKPAAVEAVKKTNGVKNEKAEVEPETAA